MSDFSNTKNYGTAGYPVHVTDSSGLFTRIEPLITPELLISRYLKGIPLKFPNGDEFSHDELKDRIKLAFNEAELLLGMSISRESRKEKSPFDLNLYRQWIHIKAEQGPVLSVEKLGIVSANDQNIFVIPAQWIEASNFNKRIINVIPLLAAYGTSSVVGSASNAGYAYLAFLNGLGFIPAFWQLEYTTGMSFKEGEIPIPVNELIGVLAAIALLSEIAPTNILNSQSLSQDGISQSSSGMGPRIYELRIAELERKKEAIIRKIKGIFVGKFFITNF